MVDINVVEYKLDLLNPESTQWQVFVDNIYVCAFGTKEEADDFVETIQDDYHEWTLLH